MIALKCFTIRTGTRFVIKNFKDTPDQELADLFNYLVKRGWHPFNHTGRFEIPKQLSAEQFTKLFNEDNLNTQIEEIEQFNSSSELIANLFQSCEEKIVWFGNYKGQKWSEMPLYYLQWLIRNSKNDEIVEHAKAVYKWHENKIITHER